MQEKVLGPSDPDSGKGKSKMSKHVTHGFHLVKGTSNHPMEDYLVAEFKHVDDNELGLFAIFDGHAGHTVPDYLRSHLFDNIINEVIRIPVFLITSFGDIGFWISCMYIILVL